MTTRRNPPSSAAIPVLLVRTDDGSTLRFSRPFHVGRDIDCDVRVDDAHVSRRHLLVAFEDGHWRLRDQGSSNGVFVDGLRVETVSIDDTVTIRLGADGPAIVMRPAPTAQPASPPKATVRSAGETMFVTERYFGSAGDEEPVGARTMMIRKAFHSVQKKQRRMYRGILAVVTVAALCAAGYAY